MEKADSKKGEGEITMFNITQIQSITGDFLTYLVVLGTEARFLVLFVRRLLSLEAAPCFSSPVCMFPVYCSELFLSHDRIDHLFFGTRMEIKSSLDFFHCYAFVKEDLLIS